ncbi:hypothetical protein [Epilithonimonas hominis]|uniref:hypothetical protein n=1 Tax=Epilithonimonas hominis TaxID=420404 RepID=UPI0016173723|nr:hypothetical protein [Epilithonimonas hominis]
MKNKGKNQKKLSLKKIQIAKLNNIKGGDSTKQNCENPDNGSTPKETVYTIGTN